MLNDERDLSSEPVVAVSSFVLLLNRSTVMRSPYLNCKDFWSELQGSKKSVGKANLFLGFALFTVESLRDLDAKGHLDSSSFKE